jgi:hypothetical protein
VGFFGIFEEHGFLYTGGSFTSIDVPGPVDTPAFGINNSGDIVGSFDDARTTHGFLATPTVCDGPVPEARVRRANIPLVLAQRFLSAQSLHDWAIEWARAH